MDGIVREFERTVPLDFGALHARVTLFADSCQVLVWGGRAHVGCTVLAQPRPSLTGQGASSTASVLNVPGHKDEALCRLLAETLAARTGLVTACSGGFHVDHIRPDQLDRVGRAANELAEQLVQAVLHS